MHFPLKKTGFYFLFVYAALFLESFIKLWLPVNVATTELDVAVFGVVAMQGQPAATALLGFWNGLLRDSLTVGGGHGWTLCLLSFAWGLALWVRDRRIGLIQKTASFFGGLLLVHTVLFFLTGAASGEKGLVLLGICLTTLAFLVGIRFSQRWLSQSGSE